MRNERGVTLITLVVTIVIMMIIAISFTTSMTSTIEYEKYNDVKEDVVKLSEEIKLYYLKNGYLPIDESHTYNLSQIPDRDKNPNDSGKYYYIRVNSLNIDLNYGDGNKNSDFNTDDVYVVNEKSLTVYYLAGVMLDGERHYTMVNSSSGGGFAQDYYSSVDLPIITVVTIESDGESKEEARIGDTITLKMLTNYDFTVLPKVKIAGHEINVNWDGNIGTATYTLTEQDSFIENNKKIEFSISNYEADGRKGDTITEVTFGTNVIFKAE